MADSAPSEIRLRIQADTSIEGLSSVAPSPNEGPKKKVDPPGGLGLGFGLDFLKLSVVTFLTMSNLESEPTTRKNAKE